VLAHLVRGTGLTGLAGIHPVFGTIIRPLLEIRREELRAYLAAAGQAWREDPTNLDTTRLRARIRHRLLPFLEKDFEPQMVTRLCRLAALAADEEAFWDSWVGEAFHSTAQRESSGAISIRAEAAARGEIGVEVALSRRLVRRIYQELRGDRMGLTALHTDQVLRLAGRRIDDRKGRARSSSGAETHLPGVRVTRDFDTLRFFLAPSDSAQARAEATHRQAARFEYPIHLEGAEPAEISMPEIGRRLRLKLIDWPRASRETTYAHVALDRDRLRSPLVVRSWLPGDSFRPSGRRHIRKLRRLLLESRISLRDRAGWPVLTSAGAIVWARGFPVAAEFAASPGTETGVLIEEELL
jgi:tRNA(Ile)-lysidine synthase